MDAKEMTFEEIKNDQKKFLETNGIEKEFEKGKFPWTELMKIGEDFEKKRSEGGEYFQIVQKYMVQIASFEQVHSYRFRIKKTGSMLAKIIKKSVTREEEISVDNYFREITDLLGVRILYVFKEDYWPVHKQIMAAYKDQLVEDISVKLKAGDDENIYSEIFNHYSNVKKETNTTYRSIHYTINARTDNIKTSPKLEIQTRSIFEEGWSEINHKLVYKKGKVVNPSLVRTSNILSELVGSCDSIGTLMKYLYDNGIRPDPGQVMGQSDVLKDGDPVGEVIRKFLLQ